MLAAVAGAIALTADAGVRLGTPFSDHMVLQQGRKAPVWGWTEPGGTVKVSFAGQVKTAKADAKGKWRVELDPLAANRTPQTLTANEVAVKDVLVGEVWFVSGQSNTECPFWGGSGRFRDRYGAMVAQVTRKPHVRYAYSCDYDSAHMSPTPLEETKVEVKWRAFTPENLSAAPSFSAIGVYFARTLAEMIDVPIGLVGAYYGGTNIDAWTPRSGYENHPELAKERDYKVVDLAGWKAENRKGSGVISGVQQQPTVLWNTMLAPWATFAARGFIWYQGCHNNGEAERYCDKMHALYDGWAKELANPGLKLYFVQLAPYRHANWFTLQLNQAKFAAEEKNAGLVTTCDIGNLEDIHPADKEPVGRRLALLALKRDYGFSDIKADAPAPVSATMVDGALEITCANVESFYVYANDRSAPDGMFEVASPNGPWHSAELMNARVHLGNYGERLCNGGVEGGGKLVLKSPRVKCPSRARYLQHRPWIGTIYNEVCLPLGPFEISVSPEERERIEKMR